MTAGTDTSPVDVVIADASAVIEAVAGDAAVLSYLEGVLAGSGMVLVPAHFWSEVANGLFNRRQRDALATTRDIQAVGMLGLQVADRGPRGLIDSVELAHRHSLTVYDAAYLQLAMDVDGELATYDRALAAAAEAEGVPIRP